MKIKKIFSGFLSLLFPELCCLCKEKLVEGEELICLSCYFKLPKTNYHKIENNNAAERFRGKIPFEKVTSFLFYNKGGMAQQIIKEIKYRGNKEFAVLISSTMAEDLYKNSFFEGIDMLIPVPLHKKKYKKRGFNQSEEIAKGIMKETGIPIDINHLLRVKENPTQTKKKVYERWLNTREIFELIRPEDMEGKHILMIDDVLTTGSTLEACIQCFQKCKSIKVSILTLAISQ
jgi:ComF family protein